MTDPERQAAERLRAGGKLLVTRLRYIGDVVLSLPLVHALRRAFPAAALHYLADPEPLQVLVQHPDLDRLWALEPGRSGTLRTARALRAQRFDAVIDLFSNPRSALLVRATGAPVRIGEARRVRRHLYTRARRLPAGRSALLQHLDAAACLGVPADAPTPPRLHLGAAERERGAVRAAGLGRDAPRVVVHLGASQPAKEWPTEHAVAFVRRLLESGVRVALTTAPRRPEPSRVVAEALPAAALLPALPLRELLGFIAAVDAVVAVDGGIVHGSVALGRPTLALFGPTRPEIWFPYAGFGPFRVLHAGLDCSACDRHLCPERTCMRALPVESVLCNVLQLLEAARRSTGAIVP
jgi:ADP-heptose:LPS heptosyltransferase